MSALNLAWLLGAWFIAGLATALVVAATALAFAWRSRQRDDAITRRRPF